LEMTINHDIMTDPNLTMKEKPTNQENETSRLLNKLLFWVLITSTIASVSIIWRWKTRKNTSDLKSESNPGLYPRDR